MTLTSHWYWTPYIICFPLFHSFLIQNFSGRQNIFRFRIRRPNTKLIPPRATPYYIISLNIYKYIKPKCWLGVWIVQSLSGSQISSQTQKPILLALTYAETTFYLCFPRTTMCPRCSYIKWVTTFWTDSIPSELKKLKQFIGNKASHPTISFSFFLQFSLSSLLLKSESILFNFLSIIILNLMKYVFPF